MDEPQLGILLALCPKPVQRLRYVLQIAGDPVRLVQVVCNLLHNAFVRAYLPKLDRNLSEIEGITFGPGSVADPGRPGEK